jgi:hypothetical protein
LLLIQLINILATAFDVTWYYYGVENFTRVVMIYAGDVWKYVLIFALCELISQFILAAPILKKFAHYFKQKWIIKSRLRPIVMLCIPQIANRMYSALDKQ